ncbi:MAG: hypothetical protein WBK56_01675 [Methanoculleus sp.]|jgi:hypothetical protein
MVERESRKHYRIRIGTGGYGMKKIQRDGLLFELIDELTNYGSWCGETHIQKATYFLEAMMGIPLGFSLCAVQAWPILLRPLRRAGIDAG